MYSRFKDNICPTELTEIKLLSSFNHGVKYSLCVIDVPTKYAQLQPTFLVALCKNG